MPIKTAHVFQTLGLPSLGTYCVLFHLILKIIDKGILITSHLTNSVIEAHDH